MSRMCNENGMRSITFSLTGGGMHRAGSRIAENGGVNLTGSLGHGLFFTR